MVEEWFQKGFIDEVKNLRRPGSGGGSSDNGIFVLNTNEVDNINYRLQADNGDKVLSAIKNGLQVYVYNSYIQVWSPVIAISKGTISSLTGDDTYPAIVITPFIYQDYQGSGTYVSAMLTKDTYDSGAAAIKIRVTSFDLQSNSFSEVTTSS